MIFLIFSEFICIGGWEEFTPTIVIDYPIHGASSYNDYSGYNLYAVSSKNYHATLLYFIDEPYQNSITKPLLWYSQKCPLSSLFKIDVTPIDCGEKPSI